MPCQNNVNRFCRSVFQELGAMRTIALLRKRGGAVLSTTFRLKGIRHMVRAPESLGGKPQHRRTG